MVCMPVRTRTSCPPGPTKCQYHPARLLSVAASWLLLRDLTNLVTMSRSWRCRTVGAGPAGALAVAPAAAPMPGFLTRQGFLTPWASRSFHQQAASPLPYSSRAFSTPAGPSEMEPPSALQQRLAVAGLADWRAFTHPRYAELRTQPGIDSAAAKIVELCKEGLAPEDVERLFDAKNSPWTSDLQAVFLPNMAYLRGLLAAEKIVRSPYEPQGLTPLGRLLRNQPVDMGVVLNRSPALIAELEAWLCDELGLSRKQLAVAVLKYPQGIYLPLGNVTCVFTYLLEELCLSRETGIELFLNYPTLFGSKPKSMARRLQELAQMLNISHTAAVAVFVRNPRILKTDLSGLPAMLDELDGFLGREGAGVALVLKSTMLATLPAHKIGKAVQSLSDLGLNMAAIRKLVSIYPELLLKDLEGPVQQQKLQWAREYLGWPLGKLMSQGFFSRSLHRMASRLSFMRHLGLPDPGGLTYIANIRDPDFLSKVGKAAGREVSAGEFAEWVAAWLQTPEGQRWGFRPPKPKKKPAA